MADGGKVTGGNYSFFNHNLRTTAMQQSFDRPKLLQQRRSQSDGNLLDSSSNKAVENKKDTPLLAREGDTQNVKFVPHPPSSPRSNSGTAEANARFAALNSKGVKRSRYESPRTSPSGSEDERRSRKQVLNVILDPLPLKRSGSTGSLDSIGSNESFGSPRDGNRSANRNLRGIEPLKDIGSNKELLKNFKSYQNSAKNEDLGKRMLRKNVVHPLRVEQQQAGISAQTTSTPIESNSETTTVLYDEPPAEDEVTLSSSNDSLTSVSDSEENSISNSDAESKNQRKPIQRDPNSTLPTPPCQFNDRTLRTNASGLYESMHPIERNQNDTSSVQTGEVNDRGVLTNSSRLYDSIHQNEGVYQNQGVYQNEEIQDDLQHDSTSDLRQLSKALEKVATDDETYASDTGLSSRSTGQASDSSISTLLPRVSARRARTRSGNFLKEEMERYLPNRQIGIFVATWNMHEEKEVPFYLDDFLIPDSTDFLQDLYIIGLQESTPQRKEWEIRLQETLGPSHVLMYSCSFGLLHLAVFIRRELVWFCSSVSEDSVSTRVGHMIKTKGALAVSFSIFGTSFLFIDSHFTSDEGKAMDRVNDYKTICKSLSLSPEGQPNRNDELDLTANFDRVFWLGDFNFRVTLDRSEVDGMLEKYKDQENPECKDLLEKDELLDLMEQGKVFVEFTEPPIKFLPSYKHDIQSDNYDSSSKHRTPSWTDRVLYRSRDPSSIEPVIYSSCVSVKTSDHRPVFGIYQVKLNPCRENIPLTGGQYIRDVYVEANRRRSLGPSSQGQSSVCIIL